MRPILRRNPGRPVEAPAPRSATGMTRGTRRALQVALLGAIVAGSSAFAVQVAGNADDAASSGTPSTLASLDPTAAARDMFAVGSRGEARETLAADVTIRVDGSTYPVVSRAATVAEALEAAGVVLGTEDRVSLPLTDALPDSGVIVVSRVTVEETTERSEVPFSTVEQPDAGLAVGVREVVTAGQVGSRSVTYRVTLVDGVEESREELMSSQAAPVDEVVRVGAEPRSIARAMVAARGWGSEQFVCLDRLWTKESNWNPNAQNRSSGAYGIPQALPGSKMGTVAADWRTNPATQITWGLNYIAGRYGTPCGAWAHSQAVNWY